ncbi:hypothetical protein XENTR_v10008783 [Xenopus tropicalis]|nr:hypothetical protein XENTR_v10008783 [Xenopus tropicalis]
MVGRGFSATVRSLLGMAIGAGICYCAYRMLFARQRKKKHRDKKGASRTREKVPGRDLHGALTKPENVSASVSDLQPHHLANLLDILVTSSDSSLQEKVLITLCNSAAFSANHDYINQTCSAISLSSLNSEVQLAGLRLIINMSVTDNYHNMVADHLPCFLYLLAEGNNIIQIYTLKVLVNLSANPTMTQTLLTAKGSQSLTSLFDSRVDREILVRVLIFAANLSKHLGSGHGYAFLICYMEIHLHFRRILQPYSNIQMWKLKSK